MNKAGLLGGRLFCFTVFEDFINPPAGSPAIFDLSTRLLRISSGFICVVLFCVAILHRKKVKFLARIFLKQKNPVIIKHIHHETTTNPTLLTASDGYCFTPFIM